MSDTVASRSPRSAARAIAHVDLDAFYASVEIRDDPSLRGLPVVVGGQSRRGVVAAASYEARKFGVHSAMPMTRAHNLCKDLVVVSPRIGYYAEVSDQFFEILGRYSPLVEGLSLDEAFIDLTGTEGLFGPPDDCVRALRKAVMDELQLACSAGIAPVKFVAKIGSDVAKPNGQLNITADQVLTFLHPLPVGRLWGVGEKREKELVALGLRTIGDLAAMDLATIKHRLGEEAGLHLHELANGRDPRGVVPDRDAKSMGHEETFEHDLDDPAIIGLYLLEQAEKVAARLRRSGLVTTGVTLKYKLADFTLVTRQCTIPATSDGGALHRAAMGLLRRHPPKRPIRLVGISAHKLGPPPQRSLLEPDNNKTDRLNAALDGIRNKHGDDALKRAGLLTLDRGDARLRPAGYVMPERKR